MDFNSGHSLVEKALQAGLGLLPGALQELQAPVLALQPAADAAGQRQGPESRREGALHLRMPRGIRPLLLGLTTQTQFLSVPGVVQVSGRAATGGIGHTLACEPFPRALLLQGGRTSLPSSLEVLEVLGILLKCQDFSQNPAAQTSALANRLLASAQSSGLSPCGRFGLGSGMRPLADATAGGLLGHVLVGGGLQEPGVGVLLHQCAGLGLGFVEASGGGTREVLPRDLPGFMVDIHLQGSSVHKD